MLYKSRILRTWYAACLGAFIAAWGTGFTAYAVGEVVQGQVTKQDASAVAGVRIELHTPDGNTFYFATTDASGNYSFTQALVDGTNYVVEVTAPAGYNRNEPRSQNFLYRTGDAVRVYNFSLTQAVKTITGTVTNTDGQAIVDADINIDPYNISGASRATARTNSLGQYTANVVGGSWFAQAVVNLSEYTPHWIAEQAPVRVDFASNTTVESTTVNFEVTTATGKVSAVLLNSDGSKLTSSNFVADIDFRRSDGVGTVRKVQQSDSALSVFLTPGIYSICAFHSDLQGKSFDPDDTTFVMTNGGIVDLGTVKAQVNTAHLKGKVTNASGLGLGGIALMAVREQGCERPFGTTQPDGTFDITVGAGTWTVGLNSTDPQYSQVAPVSGTVSNGQTVSGLNFTLKTIDKTITGDIIDSSGTKLTSYVGSAFVQTAALGAKVYAPVVNGSFTIKYSSADVPGSSVVVGAEAAEGSDYTGSAKAKVTITGPTATKNMTVLTFDATLSGNLVLPSGAAVSNSGSDITVEAVDLNGNFVSSTVGDNGAYSLPLAKGTWLFDYNLANPELTNGLLNQPAGQNQLVVSAGQTISKNILIRQGTNTITGTVTSAAGTAVAGAVVNLDNRPTQENSGTVKSSELFSITTATNSVGSYSVMVPNGTYLVSVGETPAVADTQLTPNGVSIKVSGGTTATANLKFVASNATITGQITTAGKADGGGMVTAWTDDGKSESVNVNSAGQYTLNVTAGQTWHVDVTDLKGNKMMESAQADIKTVAGKNTVNLSMGEAGVTVPGPVTKTCPADQTCSVSLPDGASVTLPPFAIDLSGNITVTLTPSIDLDKSTTNAPATLAYAVEALNNSGDPVSDLSKPAEVTIPYSQSQVATNGLVEKRLEPKYFDPNTNTWTDSGATGLVDTVNNVATIKTEHFTKFSVTGTTKKAPKITAFKVLTANTTTTILELTGSNFTGTLSATLGALKASKVELKSGKVLVTFPSKSVVKGKQVLTLTIGNARTALVTKTVTITKGIPSFQ